MTVYAPGSWTLSSDDIPLNVEEYDLKTIENIFRSVQVTVMNVRGQFKKKRNIYL